ncbi:glycine cleavage system aminomethyltransferase GcvT [Georgenia satyanarayanai]|uniref:glycine cleavage system aminomethyltransferase GcvT n=1 Tax=Georgenia satyanarayanai TaxID=860221 RepID=UPI00126437AF|nr:glycine cleavage system aminomethyltransferase GcvT [Georgenia satyanarayanai]
MSGKDTALRAEHEALGATMTSFAGWHMPLHYGSQLAEHRAVREAAGLFDLSHMGTVWVDGPGAGAFLDHAVVGSISTLEVGRAKYTLLCTPEGGIVDDLIVYRVGVDRFLTVPNAANTVTVLAELGERVAGFDARVTDATEETALLAVQGPRAVETVTALADGPVEDLRYYSARSAVVAGHAVLLARTGYTGEDGFEILVPGDDAVAVWRALLDAGGESGLVPAGLAARDSLRLEAALPLYGHELGRDVDPFTVGLGGIVGLRRKTADFVGRAALERIRDSHENREPGRRVLVGLAGQGRRAARQGAPVLVGEEEVGVVTSGLPSPTLGHPIALAVVDRGVAEVGTALAVDVRGRREAFTVVERPFYRRP